MSALWCVRLREIPLYFHFFDNLYLFGHVYFANYRKRSWRFEWWSLPTVAELCILPIWLLQFDSWTVFLRDRSFRAIQSHGKCRCSPGYIRRKNIILQRVMRFVYSCTHQLFQLKRNRHSVSLLLWIPCQLKNERFLSTPLVVCCICFLWCCLHPQQNQKMSSNSCSSTIYSTHFMENYNPEVWCHSYCYLQFSIRHWMLDRRKILTLKVLLRFIGRYWN